VTVVSVVERTLTHDGNQDTGETRGDIIVAGTHAQRAEERGLGVRWAAGRLTIVMNVTKVRSRLVKYAPALT
jgi:hypothetical protein